MQIKLTHKEIVAACIAYVEEQLDTCGSSEPTDVDLFKDNTSDEILCTLEVEHV